MAVCEQWFWVLGVCQEGVDMGYTVPTEDELPGRGRLPRDI